MSTNNNWIKMSEIKPRLADLPIWVWEKERTGPTVYTNILPGSGWSHWKHAAADIPAPPREKTQAQKDTDACDAWYNREWPKVVARYTGSMYPPPPFNTAEVWHAALAYERAEVGKMLPDQKFDAKDFHAPMVYRDRCESAIEAIRARCGGSK